MQQENTCGHAYGTRFRRPDFATMPQACGAEGIRVTDPAEAEPALRQAIAATRNRPALVQPMVARYPYPKL